MSSGNFVKVYSSILDSSIWTEELHVRVVWMAMLALADPRGMVEASVNGLTRRANVTREQCEDALARFLAPDPDSKTPENEGRRIEAVKGGWLILNYRTYRERNTSTERVRAYRERASVKSVTDVTPVTSALPLSSSLSTTEKGKGETRGNARNTGNGVLEVGELVQRIRGMGERAPSGSVMISKKTIEQQFGPETARAFAAVGGSDRFIGATGKDFSFLVREFSQALSSARQQSSNGQQP